MIDQKLAELKRQIEANLENMEFRTELYHALERNGRVQKKAMLMEALCGDPSAKLCEPSNLISEEKGSAVTDDSLPFIFGLPVQKNGSFE